MPWTAQAADVARPPVKAAQSYAAASVWSGFYGGLYAGWGLDTAHLASSSITARPRGVLLGGTAGYNRQIGWAVLGLETDFGWSDANGSFPCGGFVCGARNNWLGTVRGRAGREFGSWLPYVTAGAAYGHVTSSSTDPAIGSRDRTRLGWALGAGVENAIGGNWSVKVEYLYICLGDVGGGSVCSTAASTDNLSIKQSVIRAGVNYKFTGP